MAEYLCEEDMSTGEYISRDEALKIFHQCCDNCTSSYNGVMCRACADAGAMDILIDMPAADVQPVKHGKWLNEYLDEDDIWRANCSNCKRECADYFGRISITHNYCEYCGARMDGDTECQ